MIKGKKKYDHAAQLYNDMFLFVPNIPSYKGRTKNKSLKGYTDECAVNTSFKAIVMIIEALENFESGDIEIYKKMKNQMKKEMEKTFEHIRPFDDYFNKKRNEKNI